MGFPHEEYWLNGRHTSHKLKMQAVLHLIPWWDHNKPSILSKMVYILNLRKFLVFIQGYWGLNRKPSDPEADDLTMCHLASLYLIKLYFFRMTKYLAIIVLIACVTEYVNCSPSDRALRLRTTSLCLIVPAGTTSCPGVSGISCRDAGTFQVLH